MKRLIRLVGVTFISPEFMVMLLAFLALSNFPDACLFLGKQIGKQADLLKYLCFLPAGLLVYNVKTARVILFPSSDTKKILQSWDRYDCLKMALFVGLVYSILFAFLALLCFSFDWRTPASFQAPLFLGTIAGAFVDSASFYAADLKVEEIFRREANNPPPIKNDPPAT